jgi:hypothetical protein
MNFKIPDNVLYLAVGINLALFVLGAAIDRWDLSILAILSSMLCLFPFIFRNKE